MNIIHSAAFTAARSIWHTSSCHAQRRHLFKLPDWGSLPYPFADPAGVKPQTYREQKVLPYVTMPAGRHLNLVHVKLTIGENSTNQLRYTRQQLYAVVSDVGSYASFIPFCTRSRVLRPLTPATSWPDTQTGGAMLMEAELTVAFLAYTERYTSRVTCVPYESVRVNFYVPPYKQKSS